MCVSCGRIGVTTNKAPTKAGDTRFFRLGNLLGDRIVDLVVESQQGPDSRDGTICSPWFLDHCRINQLRGSTAQRDTLTVWGQSSVSRPQERIGGRKCWCSTCVTTVYCHQPFEPFSALSGQNIRVEKSTQNLSQRGPFNYSNSCCKFYQAASEPL